MGASTPKVDLRVSELVKSITCLKLTEDHHWATHQSSNGDNVATTTNDKQENTNSNTNNTNSNTITTTPPSLRSDIRSSDQRLT